MFIVEFRIDLILLWRHVALCLEDLPKHPSRTYQRAFKEDVRGWLGGRLIGQKDAGVEQKGPSGRICVKFLEGPVVYGFSANCAPGFLKKTELGRLSGTNVSIDDDQHYCFRVSYLYAMGEGAGDVMHTGHAFL